MFTRGVAPAADGATADTQQHVYLIKMQIMAINFIYQISFTVISNPFSRYPFNGVQICSRKWWGGGAEIGVIYISALSIACLVNVTTEQQLCHLVGGDCTRHTVRKRAGSRRSQPTVPHPTRQQRYDGFNYYLPTADRTLKRDN